MVLDWLRFLRPRRRRPARRPIRLRMEALEVRATPATFTVFSTEDEGFGTLRQAILDANDSPGQDTINFLLFGDGNLAIRPMKPLPEISDSLIIDGYSQPGATPNSLLAGNDAVLLIELDGSRGGGATGLSILADDSLIRGLVINQFSQEAIRIQGSRNVVAGNFLGTDLVGQTAPGGQHHGVAIVSGAGNRIGGVDAASRNVISGNTAAGVRVGGMEAGRPGPTGTEIVGNYIGTNAAGAEAAGNAIGVIVASGSETRIGGLAAGSGNVISGNWSGGIHSAAAAGHSLGSLFIHGNWIGTNAAGSAGLGNGGDGIRLTGPRLGETVLGGDTAPAGNVIAANSGNGIVSSSDRVVIRGNRVGTTADGKGPLGNAGHGILASGVQVQVGGDGPAAGNTIAHNGRDGVRVKDASQVDISRNAIFANGKLGINLDRNNDEVTLNDAGDLDEGPNRLQNFPMIASATPFAVVGWIDSQPNASYRIEFFASDQPDPSGFGEGQRYLGTTMAATDASGRGNFTWVPDDPLTVGGFISATATDAAGNTSEFSGGGNGGRVRGNIRVTPTTGLVTTESGGQALFSVVLESIPTAPVSIALASSDTTEGTIDQPLLVFTPQNALIPQLVTITGVDDSQDDGDIPYGIILGAAMSADPSYQGIQPSDVGVVNLDNDDSGIVVTPTSGLETSEEGKTASFTVVLTSIPQSEVRIFLHSSDTSEGTIDQDVLVFTPGNALTPQTVVITGVDDELDDGDIPYTIVTSPAASADPAYSGRDAADVAVVNLDDDGLAIDDVTVLEPDSGTRSAVFTVSLKPPRDHVVRVDYATADGTATAGADYIGTSGTLVFRPGQTSRQIVVRVRGDLIDEWDETFFVRLMNPEGASIRDHEGKGTILDNDREPTVAIKGVTVREGDAGATNAVFRLTLSGTTSRAVSVDFFTHDGTATAGQDYAAAQGTATFQPGQKKSQVVIPVYGDLIYEGDETFFVMLTNPRNAKLGANEAQGTILDDDEPPLILLSDPQLIEGGGGRDDAIGFQITLDRPSARRVIIDYTTVNGTAKAGQDYLPRSGRIVFEPGGPLSQQIKITVLDDGLDEPTEHFFLQLKGAQGGRLPRTLRARATIADRDGPGPLPS